MPNTPPASTEPSAFARVRTKGTGSNQNPKDIISVLMPALINCHFAWAKASKSALSVGRRQCLCLRELFVWEGILIASELTLKTGKRRQLGLISNPVSQQTPSSEARVMRNLRLEPDAFGLIFAQRYRGVTS